jgi:hypothetical protein
MRSRRLLVLIPVVAALAAVAGSWAYFTTSGSGAASASVGGLTTPPQPVLTYATGTATVELDWAPGSKLSDGVTPAQGYYVTRNNGVTTSPACGTSPTSLTTSKSCADSSVPNGTYTYQVVAVWNSFSATSSASEPVTVVLGGGALSNPIWTTSKSLAGASGATYTYGFTTATGAALTSVTMTVPPGTAGTPLRGTVSGIPATGTVSLTGNTLTYSFASQWINPGTVASIQITGLTNTPNVSSYTSQISTKNAAVTIDSGVTAPVAFTGGALSNPIWTTSKSLAGASGATYAYSFTTATTAPLTSVTMSVPPGTAGTPALGAVSGVPSGGTVSLSNNTLTYTFAETSIAASTAASIQVTGLTNTPNVSSYTSQITTNNATVPIDSGVTAPVAFTGGALSNPTWTTSKSEAGASGATYTYGFTTATGAALTSVAMTVPPGTAGTPALGAVSGVPGGGTVSLAGNTLTYAFASQWVNAGTAASIQITGLTNTSTPGSYSSQITTVGSNVGGPSVPIDSASSAAVAFTGGTLSNPIWTTSKSLAGASGAAYIYKFTTATTASLTSVTMTVPPGTAGTPVLGTVKGIPTGGTVSLSNNTLTYTFAETSIAASTAASIQITGLTNTPTPGSYTSQITTNAGTGPSVPIDSASSAAVAFTASALTNPTWTTSKSLAGASGATYTYGFTTATGAALTSVTMTVPPGTAGTPALGAVSGVPTGGTVSLANNTLTYAFASQWVNAGTAASIQITGLTNTSTPGSYSSQITTVGSSVGGPSVPIDSASSAAVAFTASALTNPTWTTSKSLAGATGATYAYSFTTATTASLTSVTMSVPPGTAGTPVLGTVKGIPTGGAVSLSNDTLTYAFAETSIAASTAASIQITGLTNTSTAGSYASQITTSSATAPIDSGSGAAVAFTAGALPNPTWTTSKSESGATGAVYTYSFTTATAAAITSVTMTVPPGTAGTPARGTVSGVPATGTVSLSNNTLTYTFASQWVNAGTVASIQITGLTNTSAIGSYSSQITTNGSSVGGPSIPLDSGITAAVVIGDTTPPTGSISYTNGYNTSGTVAVTFSATDNGTGVDTAAGQLKRASATLSGGSCGSFGTFENVGPEGVSSPYGDSSVATNTCYEYEYVVPDNYGLQGTITSASIVKVDTTAPSGGSVSVPAYSKTTSVAVTFSAGTDAGSGINAATPQLKRASAALTNGSCGSFGAFENVGSAGPTSPFSNTGLENGNCYEYEYLVSDNAGNSVTYGPSTPVEVDTTAPVNSLSLTGQSGGGSFLSGTTLYYRGSVLGSFKIQNAVSDSGSGPASSAFPALGGTTTGWTHTASTVSTPAGGPYVSNEFKWTAGTSSSPTETVTGTDAAGNTAAAPTLTFTRDITAPSGGSITYTNGYNTSGTVAVTFSAGTDAGSGINAASGQLKRASTTLTNGSCGTFGAFENVGPEGVSSPYNDSSVATNTCYEYEYVVSDNVGNPATITSASIVKVDTTAPANSLSLTGKSGGGSFLSGTTLYYQGSVLGSFKVQNAVSDSGSGPASSAFPALGGTTTGWTHTASTVSTPAGGPYVSNEFKWTAGTSSSPTETVTGTDAAGNTAAAPALTLTNDATEPTGSITYTNGYNTSGTVAVTFSATDTGSGVNTASGRIKRAEATYTELEDKCGSFGAFSNVGIEGQASPFSNTGLSNGKCYKYEYVVSDNVGNPATITSASVVKVDTTRPEVKEITTKDPEGKTATGKLQNGATLIITFKSRIDPASIAAGCPGSCTIAGAKETRTNNENVLLVIPGITAGSSTGSSAYLSGTATATATFTATVAFSSNNTVLTVTVSELAGATPAASEGKLKFTPASTITDPAGNTATGTLETAKIKLF